MARKKRQPTLTADRAEKLIGTITKATEKLATSLVTRRLGDGAGRIIERGLVVVDGDVKAIKKMLD